MPERRPAVKYDHPPAQEHPALSHAHHFLQQVLNVSTGAKATSGRVHQGD